MSYKYSLQDLYDYMAMSDMPRRRDVKRLISRGLLSPKALKVYGKMKCEIINTRVIF